MWDFLKPTATQQQYVRPDGRIIYNHGDGIFSPEDIRMNRIGRLSRPQALHTTDDVRLIKKRKGEGTKLGSVVQMELTGTGSIYLMNEQGKCFHSEAEENVDFEFI